MLERDFQKKRKIHNRIYSKATILLLIIVAIFLGRATWNMYTTKKQSDEDLSRVKDELISLELHQQALVADITRLQTEKGKEEEIRTKFNVAKEGETVVMLLDNETPVPPIVEEEGFFGKVWSGLVSVFE